MIKVNELDMVKFVCDVYSLSSPQGLGYLSAKKEILSLQEANEIVNNFLENKAIAVSLDYLYGRACKMTVYRSEGEGYELPDSWYDHSEAQYDELLKRHGVERKYYALKKEKQASEPTLGIPSGCTLNPLLLMAITMGGREHPCDGCNMDRNICKGYAKKKRRW